MIPSLLVRVLVKVILVTSVGVRREAENRIQVMRRLRNEEVVLDALIQAVRPDLIHQTIVAERLDVRVRLRSSTNAKRCVGSVNKCWRSKERKSKL